MAFQNLKGWTAEKDPNLWASLFLMILSVAVISEALELEVGSPGNPGSGFMIFGAAAVLGLLALHQFVKSLGLRKPKSEAASERIHWVRMVAVIVANVLYIYLLQPIGLSHLHVPSPVFFVSGFGKRTMGPAGDRIGIGLALHIPALCPVAATQSSKRTDLFFLKGWRG